MSFYEDDQDTEAGLDAGPVEGTAVIGMSGRFPGARNLGEFWENLKQGAEAVTFFSDDELRAAGVAADHLANPNYVKAASVLDRVELFDAEFFGFSPREAQVLDPQLRHFLECAWEAFEQAGYDPGNCSGNVGVYAGMRLSDYLMHHVYANPAVLETVGDFQAVLGNDKDYLATLVSYKLNLTGPSVAVQSACSTSLVAIHLASEALANRECDLALAGGATIRLPQKSGYFYHPQGIFSPDGYCRPFDARANGTIFGSGVGVVLLKRLEDALRDGDPVLAVIRGSAVNNDGAQKVGYTAPAVSGQARVIASALAMAGVEPGEIGYVECHGTGTALGDPIEVTALNRVFQAESEARRTCAIGSVKSNIGHLEAAAGITSFIKTALMLRHAQLVPSPSFESPNPRLSLEKSAFYVNTELRSWESEEGVPRRAGVSSFGIGGTNAHVVLEEAPPREASGPSRTHQLLLLSARNASALDRASAHLAAFLKEETEAPLADVAYTLKVGRRAFSHRRALVCEQPGEAAEILAAGTADRLFSGTTAETPSVAFLFPGQGAQYVRMAADLYRSEPGFRATVDRCCEILKPRLGCDLRTVLYPMGDADAATRELQQTRLTQPALFVIEYALARLLMEWGVEPQAMLGHSIGEYVAACLAGVFSLEDALALVAERGRLIQHMPAGAMLAVSLSEAAVAPHLGAGVDGLDLAAVNGPELVVVSGPEDAIQALERTLVGQGVECRRLHTSHAFHSEMLAPILDLFAEAVRRVPLRAPEKPFFSNVTGTLIRPEEAQDPDYWVRHLRQPVRFAPAVAELLREPGTILLEVGPGRTLTTFARRSAPAGAAPPLALSTLRHPQERHHDLDCLLTAVGRLWVAGVEIDWSGFHRHETRQRVALPSYPWEHRRYWIEATTDVRRPRLGKKQDVAEWFYLPSWRRALPPAASRLEPGDRWWLLAGRDGLGERLASRLERDGQEVVRIEPGERFTRLGERRFAIDPRAAEGYRELLAQAGPPRRVAHLWSLEEADNEGDALALGFGSLLSLAHLLAESGEEVEIRAVTRGLLGPAAEMASDPGRAALLGVCRAIPAEHPTLRCRVVDVGSVSGGERWLEDLLAELTGDGNESVVARNRAGRWVPAFDAVHLPSTAAGSPQWRRQGVYLLAGENSGVGAQLAAALAEELEAHVILAVGEEVEADDEAALRATVATAEQQHGVIHGVIYALGADEEPRPLADLDPGAATRSLARQARALEILARTFASRSPDFLALLSPVTALRNDAGSALVTAEAALADAFAEQRRQAGGQSWISLRFEGWTPEDARFAPSRAEGLDALERALASRGLSQVVISAGDLDARIEDRQAASGAETPETVAGVPRPELQTEYEAPVNEDERHLALIWQDLLGVEDVGVHDNFFELGGHSLVALRVLARIREACGVELDLRSLFDRPTISGLAESIAEARSAGRSAVILPPIERAAREGDLPLSSPQERLWFLQQIDGNDPSYNLAGTFPVEGRLHHGALEQSLTELVRRHEVLRTVFPSRFGSAVQVIEPPRPFVLPLVDLSGLPAGPWQPEEARRLCLQEAETPFDLERGPLFRGSVLRLGEEQHLLLLTLHHIIADGWSFGVLQRESAALAAAFTAGTRPELLELPIQYADYAVWQRQWMAGEEQEKLLAYWRQKLAGAPLLLELPVDFPRTARRQPWGARGQLILDAETSQALRRLAREQGATLFMILLAVFEMLLLVETGQEDFVVGTDVANRRPETEDLIGLFVNQVVLRSDLAGNPDFRELLGRVRQTALDAFAHQELPFERLVKDLSPERDRSYNPIFQALFLLQTNPLPAESAAEGEGFARVAAPHDLKLELQEAGEEIHGFFEYRLDLFKPLTIARMIERYRKLVALAIANPDARIEELVHEIGKADRERHQEVKKDLKKAGLAMLQQRRRQS